MITWTAELICPFYGRLVTISFYNTHPDYSPRHLTALLQHIIIHQSVSQSAGQSIRADGHALYCAIVNNVLNQVQCWWITGGWVNGWLANRNRNGSRFEANNITNPDWVRRPEQNRTDHTNIIYSHLVQLYARQTMPVTTLHISAPSVFPNWIYYVKAGVDL